MNINLDATFVKSDKIILSKIEDEYIIVPVEPQKNGGANKIYFLNKTGLEVWQRLNGKTPLRDIVQQMMSKYNSVSNEQIRQDVLTLIGDLFSLKMIIQMEDRNKHG